MTNYWWHTDGDDDYGRVRVENIRRVVAALTGKKIIEERVDVQTKYIRGKTERYDDSALIYIKEDQDEEWIRYTSIKEMCHVLNDVPDEFEPDPAKTLKGLVADPGLNLTGIQSAALICEDVVEIMAREIIYCQSFRDGDAEFLAGDGTIEELVKKRGVPAVHIERALRPQYRDACRGVYKLLPAIKPLEKI